MNPYLTGAGRSLLVAAVAFIAVGSIASQWVLLLVGVLLSSALVLAFYAMLPATLVLERRLLQVDVASPDPATGGSLLTGRPIEVDLTVRNRAGASLSSVRLIPHVGSGLELVEDVPADLRLPGYSEVQAQVGVVGLQTGRWALHGFEVRIRDMFGLFEVGEYVAAPTVLKILPEVVAARNLARPPSLKTMAQQRAGLHFMLRKGFGMELRELRNHQHGDPFRSIAWKATARTGRLMVKEYESELVLDTYVGLDISSTMRGGYGHAVERMPTKLEHGVRMAYAFAELAVSNNDRVGLVTFDEKLYGHLRPNSSRAHLANVLSHLVGVRHIVDDELTEYNDAEVIDLLVRYLLVQERLDFRRRNRLRPVRGIGQGMDYWSFSRDVVERDESVYDLELLEHWLRAVLPEEERRFADPGLELGVLSAGRVNPLRRFCQLRGIEIPYRVEARLGQKERGMVQALEGIMTQTRGGHFILLVTDLCGIMNPEPVVRALKMALTRRHKVVIATPFTPDYVTDGQGSPRAAMLHDIFSKAEREERRTVAREIEKLGIPVIPLGPGDDLRLVMHQVGLRVR